MLPLLLLLGVAPVTDETPVGPPAPHLAHTPAVQWRLQAQPAWRSFTTRWGGDWGVRFDERTGLPRFLWVPGVDLANAEALARDLAALAGVAPEDLVPGEPHSAAGRTWLRYGRTWHGAEVLGDEILLVAQGGRIGGAWVRLTPLHLSARPKPGEVVLPLPMVREGTVATGVRPALARMAREGSQVVFRDRQGRELHRYEDRRHGTLTVRHEERTVGDALVDHPARGVTVTGSAGTEITGDDGSHTSTGSIRVDLEGPDLVIYAGGAGIRVSGEEDLVLEAGSNVSWATGDVLHHFRTVWDWLALRRPDHRWLGSQVQAYVDLTSSACNAWYSSGTIAFYTEYAGYCNNFGRIADVVWHEVGHGIHHYILEGGTFAGDVSEGSADYVSATLNDDSVLAPDAWAWGGYIREIATDRVYPDHITGEVHNDGLVWGSFLWNLREAWIAEMGEEAGVEATDLLFLETLAQGPTLTDIYEAVILADDDNGDLSDGTPHACALADLLDQHGLGPGPIGVVVFDHEPVEAPASSAEGYEVGFDLYALTADCADLDEGSVALWYQVDPEPMVRPAPDTGDTGDTGEVREGWTRLPLTRSGNTWTGTIPRQPATALVSYYMEASSSDGTQTVTTHGGRAEDLYRFRVGDRADIWCEGFEEGAPGWTHGAGTPSAPDTSGTYTDEWTVGPPVEGTFGPSAAWAGVNVAGTALGTTYGNNNAQYLRSPELDLAGRGPMLMLAYRRWLTVEDGIYDHARVLAGSDVLWENPASEDGTLHVLDTAWQLHELDLDPEPVRLAWTLQSDPGLEFSGWALDEVCVVELADVAGHYRVDDLQATRAAGPVQVSYSVPWMVDLKRIVVVKRQDRWPTSPWDGTVLHDHPQPVPGEEVRLEDPEVGIGEVAYYVAFTLGGGAWNGEVVWGENAARGAYRRTWDTSGPTDTGEAPPGDTGEAPPEDTGDGSDDDGAGPPAATRQPPPCGCATGGAWGWGWSLALAVVALRRRPTPPGSPRG